MWNLHSRYTKLHTEVQLESDELQLAAHCLPAAAPDIQEQEPASSCWGSGKSAGGSGTSAGGSGTPFSSCCSRRNPEDQTLYGFGPAGIAVGATAAAAVTHGGCTLAPSSLPHNATATQPEGCGAAAASAWDADPDDDAMEAIQLSLETIACSGNEEGPRAATLPSLQRVLLVEDSDLDDDDTEEPVAGAIFFFFFKFAMGGRMVDGGDAGPGGCQPGAERQPQQAAATDQGVGRSGATEAPTPAAAAACKSAVAATAASSPTYLLQGAVLHHGPTPFSGHYTASVLCKTGRVSPYLLGHFLGLARLGCGNSVPAWHGLVGVRPTIRPWRMPPPPVSGRPGASRLLTMLSTLCFLTPLA